MDRIIMRIIEKTGDGICLAGGILSHKSFYERIYSFAVRIALIIYDIIPDDMFVNLEKVEIELIKKELNLNCYPIKKDTTFITKGGPPLTKSIKQKNTKLILDFYSKEMLLPGPVRKSSIWEIVVREEDFPLNEETKEIVEKLTEIINTVESMEFPNHRGIRPKNFILEQTLSNNEVKRTKIKKFSGKWYV